VRKGCTYKGRKIAIGRKVATSIRETVWERILDAIMEAFPLSMCKINKQERRIVLPNGSEFIFFGADNPEKMKSIEKVTDYWLEEATEFNELDFDTLDAGMSTPCEPPPAFYLTFNPVPQIAGYQHWLQKRFIDVEHEMSVPRVTETPTGQACVLRTWYKDNAHCPKRTVIQLEGYKEVNPALYLMWARGEFTELEGSILRAIPEKDEKSAGWNVVKTVPEGVRFLGYSIDFGYANDPAAVVAVWKHNRDVWVKQMVYMTGLTNQDLSEAMTAVGMSKNTYITADSAEPKSIEELCREGWMVKACKKWGKSFKPSAALFMQGLRIHVIEGSLELMKECATWSWRQDKEGHVLPLVADGNDHGIDAVVYKVYLPGSVIDFDEVEKSRATTAPLRTSIISRGVPAMPRS